MCIDIVKIWFGIANGQISSIFDRVICLGRAHIPVIRDLGFSRGLFKEYLVIVQGYFFFLLLHKNIHYWYSLRPP